MANYSVTPQGLRFNNATVQGSVPGLFATPQTLTFVLTNTSGSSVNITNYGFSTTTDADAVTQPNGIYTNSDFKVTPTGGLFPVTVNNNATQSFTVTYSPLRRGSGFGDIRSAILTLYSGYAALINTTATLDSSGRIINDGYAVPVTVGVGGGVIEEGYDWPSSSPIYWSAGTATAGTQGVANNVQGMTPNMTLAAMDTTAHYSPMLFWATNQTGSQSASTYRAPTAATYTTGSTSVPYAIQAPYVYGSPRGGRSYQILVFFTDDTVTMNINIYAIASAGNVLVATFTGITYNNAMGLFVGNNESTDLEGLSLAASTTVTAGSTAYNIGAVITG